MRISAAEPASGRGIRTRYAVAGSLILGVAIVVMVAVCTILAWPAGSMVAAQPAAGSTGDLRWLRLFALAQILAFGLFAAAVLIIRRRPARTAHVVLIAAIIQLLPLAAPLMLSTDVYSYWNAGRLAAHEPANPYLDVPADYPSDPSFPYIPAEWRDRPTVYGPAFTLISEGIAVIAGDQTLFVNADEVEASWRLYDPLLRKAREVFPYAAGSWGPKEADRLIGRHGGRWHSR